MEGVRGVEGWRHRRAGIGEVARRRPARRRKHRSKAHCLAKAALANELADLFDDLFLVHEQRLVAHQQDEVGRIAEDGQHLVLQAAPFRDDRVVVAVTDGRLHERHRDITRVAD